ncbi:unnamed protein product, partial [Oikopleura dioica]
MDASAVMDKLPTPKIPSRSSVTTNDVTMDVTQGIGCQGTFIDSDDESMMEATTELTTGEPVSTEVESVSSALAASSTMVRPKSTENETDAKEDEKEPVVETEDKQTPLQKSTVEELSSEELAKKPASEELSSELGETFDNSAPFAEETASADTSEAPSSEQVNEKSTVAKKAEVSLPRPVRDYLPRLNDSECMIVEPEQSTNEEPSTLDDGSLTPDSFVDLTTPEKEPESRKKTAAARKLKMPKPIVAGEPIRPAEQEASAEKKTAEEVEKPLKMTRTDQFGFEVPYLRKDPDRPKSDMEKLMEEDDPELVIPKSDDEESEAEKQN